MAPGRLSRILVPLAALTALIALALPATAAAGPVRVVHAAGGAGKVATFRLAGLSAARIQAGWIAPHGLRKRRAGVAARRGSGPARGRRLDEGRLRRAARRGVLRIRVGRARSPKRRSESPALVVELARPAAGPSGEETAGQTRKQPGPDGPGKGKGPKEPAPEPEPESPAPAPEPAPEPEPEPAPEGSGSPTGGECETATVRSTQLFAPGAWPGGCWRPYSDSSPFNRPLPPNPRLVGNSSAIVDTLTSWGQPADLRAGIADTGSDWDHPIYFASASDPVFTVHCTASWGKCEIEGEQIHIPQAARAAGGGDAHMTVIDQAGGWEYDLYKYCYEGCSSSNLRTLPSGGGKISIRWGGKTPLDGDGLGSDATAALFGLAAGVIRPEELLRGHIDHALFMVVRCDSGKAVWPAAGLGLACSGGGADAPAEGTRFQLDMSAAEIDALAVPAWKKTILRAMAEYGMYVGDTSGSTPWNIQFASGSTYTSFGAEDQLVRAAKALGVRPSSDGRYYFDIASGVDWKKRLRVIDPCVARGTC